jgi:hypothetical protein
LKTLLISTLLFACFALASYSQDTTKTNQDTLKEVSTIGIFDGQTYMGVHGESVYKINEYQIYFKDISKSQVDSLKGKKVLVTGKLNEVQGKTQVTINNNGEKIYKLGPDFFSYISGPIFSIVYDTREPLSK